MLIKINGEDVDIPEGSTIKDAIEISNAPYKKGSIVCLIKGESEIQSNILKYKIKTPKGSILIELEVSEKSQPLTDFFKENYSQFISNNVRWETSNEVQATFWKESCSGTGRTDRRCSRTARPTRATTSRYTGPASGDRGRASDGSPDRSKSRGGSWWVTPAPEQGHMLLPRQAPAPSGWKSGVV